MTTLVQTQQGLVGGTHTKVPVLPRSCQVPLTRFKDMDTMKVAQTHPSVPQWQVFGAVHSTRNDPNQSLPERVILEEERPSTVTIAATLKCQPCVKAMNNLT